jgi:hypothetical protein
MRITSEIIYAQIRCGYMLQTRTPHLCAKHYAEAKYVLSSARRDAYRRLDQLNELYERDWLTHETYVLAHTEISGLRDWIEACSAALDAIMGAHIHSAVTTSAPMMPATTPTTTPVSTDHTE